MVSGSGRRKSGVLKASELSSVLVWHRPSFTQPTSTLVWTTTRGIRWVQDYREKSSMRTFIEWENVRRVSQLNEPAGETTTSVFDEICLERRKFGPPPSSSCCFCIESFDNPPLSWNARAPSSATLGSIFATKRQRLRPWVRQTTKTSLRPRSIWRAKALDIFSCDKAISTLHQ